MLRSRSRFCFFVFWFFFVAVGFQLIEFVQTYMDSGGDSLVAARVGPGGLMRVHTQAGVRLSRGVLRIDSGTLFIAQFAALLVSPGTRLSLSDAIVLAESNTSGTLIINDGGECF